MGPIVKSQSHEPVYNLHCYFEEHTDNSGPIISVAKIMETVAAALKIGQTSVLTMPGKSRPRASAEIDIDTFLEDAIWQILYIKKRISYMLETCFTERKWIIVCCDCIKRKLASSGKFFWTKSFT